MKRALAYKELRETTWIGLVAMAALLLLALTSMGWSVTTKFIDDPQRIPFINDLFFTPYVALSVCLVLALGLRQSMGDFHGDAHLFLLHRPIRRRSIYVMKMVVGLAVYLVCVAVPVLVYARWASLPGSYAAPFDWAMTHEVWGAYFTMPMLYLGAFLSGVRPAAWIGTRLAPLAATLFIAMWLSLLTLPGVIVCATLCSLLLSMLILQVVTARDFA